MSETQITNTSSPEKNFNITSILQTIFYTQNINNIIQYIPIIKSTDNIITFINHLNCLQIPIETRISYLQILNDLFSKNLQLIPLIEKTLTKHKTSLFKLCINLYLNNPINSTNEEIIFSFLNVIINNITLTKDIFDYIYNSLANISIKHTSLFDKLTDTECIDENVFIKYLKLFQLLYNGSQETLIKRIRNYIYFNGTGSKFNINMVNHLSTKEHKFKLSKGFTLSFWFKINEKLFLDYYTHSSNQQNSFEINIMHIKFNDNLFLKLKLTKTGELILSGKTNSKAEISEKLCENFFEFDTWNNLTIILSKISPFTSQKIYIYNNWEHTGITPKIDLHKFTQQPITNITLFENFIGKVTSVLFFSSPLDDKSLKTFKQLKYGFYKNNLLYQFMKANDNNYLEPPKELNDLELNTYSKINNKSSNHAIIPMIENNITSLEKESDNEKEFISQFEFVPNIKDKKVFINQKDNEHLIGIFCPFCYDINNNVIDDICCNYTTQLGINDGSVLFNNTTKDIVLLGGINNLLPIAEIILVDNKLKHSEKVTYEYLLIIEYILSEKIKNSIHAKQNNFFQSLGMFLEQYPDEIFSERILDVLYNIGKIIISFEDSSYTNIQKKDFFHTILLNIRIFSKFNLTSQMKLWNYIYLFYESDPEQRNNFLEMSTLCAIIRYYDQPKFKEACCKKHATMFNNSNIQIMEPELYLRVKNLFEVIQIVIDSGIFFEQLFKLLTLDLSQCMKKSILLVIINYLLNKKIDDLTRFRNLELLFLNNCIEISLFVLSTNLYDIRCEVIQLLCIITNEYSNISTSTLNNKINPLFIYYFIHKNILLSNSKLQLPSSSSTEQNEISLLNIIDKHKYEEQIQIMWDHLIDWVVLSKDVYIPNNNDKRKGSNSNSLHNSMLIQTFALDFLIEFSTKIDSFKYIAQFLESLHSFLNDELIENGNELLLYDNIYNWVIETIFLFHGDLITDNKDIMIDKMGYDDNLQNKKEYEYTFDSCLNLFCEMMNFDYANEKDGINIFYRRVSYIIEYGLYLKSLKIENDLIVNVIRKLLEKAFTCINKNNSNGNNEYKLNYITKICFEFMFLFNISNKIESQEIHFEDFQLSPQGYIPQLLFEGLSINNNTNNKTQSNLNETNIPIHNEHNIISSSSLSSLNCMLSLFWLDYNLFDNIIEHYFADIELNSLYEICNIDITDEDEIPQLLIKQFGFNKKLKNILLPSIKKLLSIPINNNNPTKNSYYSTLSTDISIIRIIPILLSVSIDITKNADERNFWCKQLLDFLIYCVLVSINIQQSEKDYNYIQNEISIVLSFGCLFLKDRNESLYKVLTHDYISEVFHQISEYKFKKNAIKKLFTDKNDQQKSAINLVFDLSTTTQTQTTTSNVYESSPRSNRSNSYSNINTSGTQSKSDDSGYESSDNINSDDNMSTSLSRNVNRNVSMKSDCQLNCKSFFQFLMMYQTMYIKEYKQSIIDINFYYNALIEKYVNENDNKNIIIESKYIKAKTNVEKNVKKYITSFENEKKHIQRDNWIRLQKAKKIYRKQKKEMFAWNGSWANHSLFYSNNNNNNNSTLNLKYKLKNHFTTEMTKPLLSPIYDIEYSLPIFSKFDTHNLFNTKTNYKYKINMNIDNILLTNPNQTSCPLTTTSSSPTTPATQITTINDINCNNFSSLIIKHNFPLLYETYNEHNYINGIDIYSYFHLDTNTNSMNSIINAIKENKKQSTIKYDIKDFRDSLKKKKGTIFTNSTCCLVKTSHHIKGDIWLCNKGIKFYPEFNTTELSKRNETDINYDTDRSTCFGSYFNPNKKDYDIYCKYISYNNIKYIFKRTYFYQENSIEIYTNDNKNYYFTFPLNEQMNSFINTLLEYLESVRKIIVDVGTEERIIGYERSYKKNEKKQLFGTSLSLAFSNKTKENEWCEYKISTLAYLMWLNVLGNRSYSDINQYPIAPWLFMKYNQNEMITINDVNDLRNLSLPMGMIVLDERSERRINNFKETYETLKSEYDDMIKEENGNDIKEEMKYTLDPITNNQKPHFYGTHYSNPTYVSHYLMRMFPYANIAIEIQGTRFDDPDRLFISIAKSFESCVTMTTDVRELIPEFFYIPDFLMNVNNLNLDQVIDNDNNNLSNMSVKKVNNVSLPKWCNSLPTMFIIKQRLQLENINTNSNLPNWINLIFGYYQRSPKAETQYNLFMANTYKNEVNISKIESKDNRDALMRIVELGITPDQLFTEKASSRQDKPNSLSKTSGEYLFTGKNLKVSKIPFTKVNFPKNQIIKMKTITNNKILLLTKDNNLAVIKLSQVHTENKIKSDKNHIQIPNDSNKYILNYSMKSLKKEDVTLIYCKGKVIVQGGFWDGRLEIHYDKKLFTSSQRAISSHYDSFSIYDKHQSPITAITINNEETFLICGKLNGIINIYQIHNSIEYKLYHTLYDHKETITSIAINSTLNIFTTASHDGYVQLYTLPQCKKYRSLKLNKNIHCKNIFICSCPLPSIILYTNVNTFISYTVNGMFISQSEERSVNIINPIQMKSPTTFEEYLIYGTNDGCLMIRNLPMMEIVNEVTVNTLKKEIKVIEVSYDYKYCYVWFGEDDIHIIKDSSVLNRNVNDNTNQI